MRLARPSPYTPTRKVGFGKGKKDNAPRFLNDTKTHRQIASEAYEAGRQASHLKPFVRTALRNQIDSEYQCYFDDGSNGEVFTLKG